MQKVFTTNIIQQPVQKPVEQVKVLDTLNVKNLNDIGTKELIKIISHLASIIDINMKTLADNIDDFRRELLLARSQNYNSYLSIDDIHIKDEPSNVFYPNLGKFEPTT